MCSQPPEGDAVCWLFAALSLGQVSFLLPLLQEHVKRMGGGEREEKLANGVFYWFQKSAQFPQGEALVCPFLCVWSGWRM